MTYANLLSHESHKNSLSILSFYFIGASSFFSVSINHCTFTLFKTAMIRFHLLVAFIVLISAQHGVQGKARPKKQGKSKLLLKIVFLSGQVILVLSQH